ncbi:hypothetical protein [Vallitalea okinawensis]|uniref:hypothetical protein n=1 Tax=Vallitalea okinawensis TaxID=2078660 RepID=UPI000CFCEF2D|nr:hypothetical protein [Vallitalea okinawensis]
MKRLIALAMVVTMGLSGLVGCTNTENPEDQTTGTEVSTEVEEGTETEEADQTEENAQEEESQEEESQEEEKAEVDENSPNAKVAVNISGTIEEISEDGTKIKVNDQWIIITEETSFLDDPDNGAEEVSKEFEVGNVIQGWTADDVEAEEVTAGAIYSNSKE